MNLARKSSKLFQMSLSSSLIWVSSSKRGIFLAIVWEILVIFANRNYDYSFTNN